MLLSPSTAILRAQPDERLVQLAGAGSEAAFAAIVERYRPEMMRACRRVLPEARAEDAVQQVFISAWKALLRGDQVRDLRPWLHAIARNAALDALRSPGYDLDELQDTVPAGDGPETQLEHREAVRSALTGLAALPDRQRIVILSSAVGGLSHADIAARMGMTEGATRQMLLRARTTLRSAVAGLTPPPLLAWAASGVAGAGDGGGTLLQRIAELAAGGSAGAGAIGAKVGVVAVVAAGAAAAPAVVHDLRTDKATRVAHVAKPSGPSARPPRLTVAALHEHAASGRVTSHPAGPGAHGDRRHGGPSPTSSDDGSSAHDDSGPSSSGRSGSSPSVQSSPSGDDAHDLPHRSDDQGGTGGGSHSSGGTSNSHDAGGSHGSTDDLAGPSTQDDSSGHGSGSDDVTSIPPAPTPSPTVDDGTGHSDDGGSTSGPSGGGSGTSGGGSGTSDGGSGTSTSGGSSQSGRGGG